MPCPAIPAHRCLDCAPRGRVFSSAGLHPGNPLEPRDPGPAGQDPAAFAEHWEAVTVPRPSLTFDGAEPNHDHVVRIAQPSKKTGSSSRSTKPQSAKRPAVTIPVILAF